MPLSMLKKGEVGLISGLSATGNTRQHLLDMGFVQGQCVTVVGETSDGLILQIKGVRLALNKGLAHKILVA